MNILYWGTPEYSVPTLLALHNAGHQIVGVVSQPDRRRGRGKQLLPSAVKICAHPGHCVPSSRLRPRSSDRRSIPR
jgi:methionyl-tRNA formyltransferase